jgi:hypothetical protein
VDCRNAFDMKIAFMRANPATTIAASTLYVRHHFESFWRKLFKLLASVRLSLAPTNYTSGTSAVQVESQPLCPSVRCGPQRLEPVPLSRAELARLEVVPFPVSLGRRRV